MRSTHSTCRSRVIPGVLAAACWTLGCSALHGQAPLTLHEAIERGLRAGPEARADADRVDLQRAQVAGARQRPNPHVFLQSEDLRPWAQNFSFENNTEDYGYASQALELDGKRGKRIAYADDGLRRAEAEHTLALRRLAAGIASAYWSAAATRAVVGEWQGQLAGMRRLVQYQSDRVAAGAAAGVDLLRTEIERDRVALALAGAERDAEAAGIELARRTGSPAARTSTLADPLEAERPVPDLPLPTAVEARPDVQAAREAVTEMHADLRLQQADRIPDLDLLGGYKRDVGLNTLFGGLQFDVPLFNRNQGGIAAARAGEQLAEDQLAFARLNAASEIESAYGAYTREEALVRETLPGMGSRAGQHETIITDAYRSGGVDLLRLLDAERVLVETRLLAIQTWREYQQSVVALQLAYGEQP